MGSQPRTWGRLGILTHEQRSVPRFSAGLFEAQLGTFSLGGYKVPRKNEPYQPYRFLFPTCLSSQSLTLSTSCRNSANLSFSSNFKEFAGSAATILVLCQPESHPFPQNLGLTERFKGEPLGFT